MATRLVDLEALEVSLVDKAANKRRFLLLKNEDGTGSNVEAEGGGEMNDVLKSLLDVPVGNEAELLKQLMHAGQGGPDDLSERANEAVKASVRLLAAVREELPEGLCKKVDRFLSKSDEAPQPEPTPVEAEDTQGVATLVPTPEQLKKKDGKLDFSGVPTDVRPVIEALWKEHEEVTKRAKELEATLKAERDQRLLEEFTQKAAGFENLGLNPTKMGPVFKTLSEKAPGEWETLENLLKAMDERFKQSTLFKEIGTSAATPDVGSTWGQITQMAEQMVSKSEDGLTKEQAITKILEQNPGLYNQYLSERG
jgi:hypothetical protein